MYSAPSKSSIPTASPLHIAWSLECGLQSYPEALRELDSKLQDTARFWNYRLYRENFKPHEGAVRLKNLSVAPKSCSASWRLARSSALWQVWQSDVHRAADPIWTSLDDDFQLCMRQHPCHHSQPPCPCRGKDAGVISTTTTTSRAGRASRLKQGCTLTGGVGLSPFMFSSASLSPFKLLLLQTRSITIVTLSASRCCSLPLGCLIAPD